MPLQTVAWPSARSWQLLGGVVLTWELAVCISLSGPDLSIFPLHLFLGLLGLVIVPSIPVFVIRDLDHLGRDRLGHRPWWWAGVAATVGLTVLAVVADAPAALRISASRSYLEAAGRDVLAGRPRQSAGLYRFVETYAYDGCAYMIVGQPFIDRSGFAYCPAGRPAGSSDYEYGPGNGPLLIYTDYF